MNTQEEEQTVSVWDYLEQENTKAPQAEALYRWGLNCDRLYNPYLAYLDLIGWSEEHIGEALFSGSLGYLEADYLADALKEWANNPQQVEAWVAGLMNTEGV